MGEAGNITAAFLKSNQMTNSKLRAITQGVAAGSRSSFKPYREYEQKVIIA